MYIIQTWDPKPSKGVEQDLPYMNGSKLCVMNDSGTRKTESG